MKKIIMTLCTTALISGSACVALASEYERHGDDMPPPPREHMKKMYKNMDSNGDGIVSKSEFIAHTESRFEKMDADKDGNLTKEEMREHHKERREKMQEMHEKMRDRMHGE